MVNPSPPDTAVAGIANRPLKRRYTATPDMSFFTPAEETFQPRPYLPHSSQSIPHHNRASTREAAVAREVPPTRAGTFQQHAPPTRSYEPFEYDPDVVFIHPPFDNFPNAHLYPDGLTYNLLADNPEWFLDPADYKAEGDTNPNALVYPQNLEPPRGWCPGKKKDTKNKNADGTDDNEPKLRCTFCRRKYAGVNAKSMWRRHVLEKHKIPMSNRREGPIENARQGRTANKENRNISTTTRFVSSIHRLKSASMNNLPDMKTSFNVYESAGAGIAAQAKLRLPPTIGMLTTFAVPLKGDTARDDQQALEPQGRLASPTPSPEFTLPTLPPTSPNDPSLSMPPPPDPTRTPLKKPTRDLFQHPWRFPSPSHPLYSSPNELCLGVPIGGIEGEGLRGSYIPVQSSPFGLSSIFGSPLKHTGSGLVEASPLSSKVVMGKVRGWKRSSSDFTRPTLTGMDRPEPRRLFYEGPLPVPVTDRLEMMAESDLSMSTDGGEDYSSFSSSLDDSFMEYFNMQGISESPAREPPVQGPSSAAYPVTPVKKPIGLPLSELDGTSLASWLKQPSGIGLGISVEAHDDRDGDNDSELGELLYPPPTPPPASAVERDEPLSQEMLEVETMTYAMFSQEEEELEGPDDSPISENEEMFDEHYYFQDAHPALKRRKTAA